MWVLLSALFAVMVFLGLSQGTPCQATGTLTLEQPGASASSPVVATATVDAADPACRAIARKEPFLIVRGGNGATTEVALSPVGTQFRGEFPLPAAPFTVQLYADGIPDVLATATTIRGAILDLPPNLQWLRRSEGALLVVLVALGLGVVALIGMPAGARRG